MKKLRLANAALQSQNDELVTKTSQLQNQLKERAGQLKERDEQLQEARKRADALLSVLRALVEAKARQAGRDDILALLPAATDVQQLQAWLTVVG
jgi:hypothetical protein